MISSFVVLGLVCSFHLVLGTGDTASESPTAPHLRFDLTQPTFDMVDANHDGLLDETETVIAAQQYLSLVLTHEEFALSDTDLDGFLSLAEARALLVAKGFGPTAAAESGNKEHSLSLAADVSAAAAAAGDSTAGAGNSFGSVSALKKLLSLRQRGNGAVGDTFRVLDCKANCAVCPPGNTMTCTTCNPGYQKTYSNGYMSCTPCMSTGCVTYATECACSLCSARQYIDTYGDCGVCQPGCTSYTNPGVTCSCAVCAAGYYKDANNLCQLCSQACTACTNSTTCTSCIEGWTLNPANGGFCQICPPGCISFPNPGVTCNCTACRPGFFLNAGATTCTACCDAGCSSYSSACECNACATGFGLIGFSGCGGTSHTSCAHATGCTGFSYECQSRCLKCTSCSAGYTLWNGKCSACGVANCQICSEDNHCTHCNPGYFPLNDGTCTTCDVPGQPAPCAQYGDQCKCCRCKPGFCLSTCGVEDDHSPGCYNDHGDGFNDPFCASGTPGQCPGLTPRC